MVVVTFKMNLHQVLSVVPHTGVVEDRMVELQQVLITQTMVVNQVELMELVVVEENTTLTHTLVEMEKQVLFTWRNTHND